MKKILKFPRNFLWGVATSAYQVEGGIENCDWSKFHPAKKACDHYRLFKKDIKLMKKLNLTAYRFSIEWSRIEPEEGKFNKKEIDHYKNFLIFLKKQNLKSMVTLWHFTTPLWLVKKGGWENKKIIFYFKRYSEKVVEELKDFVDFWITINEPLVYTSNSYLKGSWPPQKKNIFSFLKVVRNFIKAHKEVFLSLKEKDKKIKIGIAKSINFISPFNRKSPLDKFSSFLAKYFWTDFFLKKIKNELDFIGLNYYTQNKIKFPFFVKKGGGRESDIGWEIYPKGIYFVLKDLKKYNLPIFITENGIADRKDKFRKEFIKEHLFWIHKALQEGVDVRGYFHWSLMDNLEWALGFSPRFGLIEINYKTLERKIRPSAFYYGKIAKENALVVP